MDELEISGKRFISSKRAAKENRYHTDYIGQLIRSGKIVGSKVGRTWYVEEESLASYLGKPYEAPTTPAPSPEIFVPKKVTLSPGPADEFAEPHESPESASHEDEAEKVETIDSVLEHERAEMNEVHHVSIMKVHKEDIDKDVENFVSNGLRYIEDDEPLLPRLGTPERKVAIHTQSERAPELMPIQNPVRRETISPRPQRRIGQRALLLASVAVGAAAFFGSIGLSYFLTSNTTAQVANVASSAQH